MKIPDMIIEKFKEMERKNTYIQGGYFEVTRDELVDANVKHFMKKMQNLGYIKSKKPPTVGIPFPVVLTEKWFGHFEKDEAGKPEFEDIRI